jgi:3',5'-cyclic AMP phosphodiesterase CpdA
VADSSRSLALILADLEATGIHPEALIFTGDLADRGEPAAYRNLRAVVEPAARRMGSRIIWVMGNHDERASFREHLTGEPAATGPYDRVEWLGGLRVVVLDSTVPGRAHGEIAAEQLEWLAGVLATPAPEGTLLLMHHPPVPCVQDLAVTVELRDQGQLEKVLAGSDVRSILAGHLHYSSHSTFAGIPVSVASATCYTQDLTAPLRGTRGRDSEHSYNLVHVYRRTVMHSVVPLAGGTTVKSIDAAATADHLARRGVHIPEAPALPIPVPLRRTIGRT